MKKLSLREKKEEAKKKYYAELAKIGIMDKEKKVEEPIKETKKASTKKEK